MIDRRGILFGGLLLVLAAVSWWLRQSTQPEPARQPRAAHTPDYWVDGLRATTTDRQGRPRQRLRAVSMRHYPDDDSTELSKPEMQLLAAQRPPWNIRSDTGWVSPDGGLILLQGEVQIDREAAPALPPVHLITRDLRVQPKDEYAETDQPVRATSGPSWVTSIGMQAWLREPVRIKLLSQVRAHHEVIPE